MAQLFTDFDGATVVGDVLAYEAWSPSTAKTLELGAVAWDGTQAVGFGAGTNTRHFAQLLDIPSSNNIEIYGLLKADGTGENDLYVGGNTGYNAYKFDIRSSGLRISKFVAGTGTFGIATAAAPFSTGDVIHVRCRWDANTGAIKLRVWPELDAEPSTWNIDTTDTDLTAAGTSGLFTFTDDFRYSRIGVGTDGDAAPTSAVTGDDLLANDIESGSEVTAPTVGQAHILAANNVDANSETSAPSLAQEHALSAQLIESGSEVSVPALAEAQDNLAANDIESASGTSPTAISQVHMLTATGLESATEAGSSVIGQTHIVAANDAEASSVISQPGMGQSHKLLPSSVKSMPIVSSPALVGSVVGLSESIKVTMADTIQVQHRASPVTVAYNADIIQVDYKTEVD